MKIHLLDEQTINLIAAGEVVEDPSSIVKELVDNAIDAGATKIRVQVQGSGRISILVQDNGCGMGRDDALLSFERHATSKIQKADDLWKLQTMGFRGEALASIAAVSEVSLLTAEREDAEEKLQKGTSVQVKFGKVTACQEASSFAGTTITVRSLFHNTPVRQKFQKTAAREAQEIIKAVSALALAAYHISFELHINGKRVLFCDAAKKEEYKKRVQSILGAEYTSQMVPVEYKNSDFAFFGFLGKPFACKTNRSGQLLFINGRPIESSFISSSIKEAYGTSIEPQKHPSFCLHITMEKSDVDVNVHPQKKHARFSVEGALASSCMKMVHKTLFEFSENTRQEIKEPFVYTQSSFSLPAKPFMAPMQKPLEQESLFTKDQFRVIGTLWHYIFVQFPEEEEQFSCVDARRAASKIASSWFSGSFERKPCIQSIIKPIFFEASAQDAARILASLGFLQECGLLVREFGANAFLIEGYTSQYEHIDVKALIYELIDEDGREDHMKALHKVVGSCPKIKMPISEEQGFLMIKQLLALADPWICPQGAPIRVQIAKQELVKKF
jgi:DNA mismatch repair protein MutL